MINVTEVEKNGNITKFQLEQFGQNNKEAQESEVTPNPTCVFNSYNKIPAPV